jgi:hypothetical protein
MASVMGEELTDGTCAEHRFVIGCERKKTESLSDTSVEKGEREELNEECAKDWVHCHPGDGQLVEGSR